MAAKKKKSAKKAKKNPVRHIPKTGLGRPPVKRPYVIQMVDADDVLVGERRGSNTVEKILLLGQSLVKGKVARVVVDY